MRGTQSVRSRALRVATVLVVGLSLAGCATSRVSSSRPEVTKSGADTARVKPTTHRSTGREAAPVHEQHPAAHASEHARSRQTAPSLHPASASATDAPSAGVTSGSPVGAAPDIQGEGGSIVGEPGGPALARERPAAAESVDSIDPGHTPFRSPNAAVNALLAQADGSRRGGNLNGAIASAERALRIAPADPVAYYELALLRLAHGERAVAEQLARKGLGCQPDAELRQRLQDLIARAHSG